MFQLRNRERRSSRLGTGRALRAVAPAAALTLASVWALAQSASVPAPQNLRISVAYFDSDFDFYPGDYSQAGVIGNSLPGTWRPFFDESPWNSPIAAGARLHPDSAALIAAMVAKATNVRLSREYTSPVWVVNSENVPLVPVRSDYIFDFWDVNRNGWTDIGVPITPEMWGEPTTDGHIVIIDPFRKLAYEMSKFQRLADGTPSCSTFNVWDITQRGYGDPNEGQRWQLRGGRGSGFPIIAGMIRPEELAAGEIRHALTFSYPENRQADDGSNIFLPPACRSDGRYRGASYPVEGLRLQLDPSLTDADFNAWGLNREGKIVARALQRYGMYLGDNGSPMVMAPQLLGPTADANYAEWERRFPGFYKNVEKIPTARFRALYTGEPIVKR